MKIYDNYNNSEQISSIVDFNANQALHRSLAVDLLKLCILHCNVDEQSY